MTYILYVLVKLACYTGWCWLGLRLWRPDSATPGASFRFGLLRLGIGVLFGTAIFIIVSTGPDDLLWKYLKIYTPVRLVEWFILAWIILRESKGMLISPTTGFWCLGGIVVSFAADFTSPAGLEGHFCVGRCLC